MSETFVTMVAFQQDLANLINRVAADGERIGDQYTHALTATDRLRDEVAQWRAPQTIGAESVVETLRQLREGRDDELTGLR
jgi:hypothetical protein